jgi:hypothetical protein
VSFPWYLLYLHKSKRRLLSISDAAILPTWYSMFVYLLICSRYQYNRNTVHLRLTFCPSMLCCLWQSKSPLPHPYVTKELIINSSIHRVNYIYLSIIIFEDWSYTCAVTHLVWSLQWCSDFHIEFQPNIDLTKVSLV